MSPNASVCPVSMVNRGGASSYRPAILKAIKDNREAIDSIKKAIQHEDDYNVMRHNDAWILRFVRLYRQLGTPSAVEAAKGSLSI